MCGIVAYIGDRQAKDVLIEGLIILQNRGYDSAGISTIDLNRNLITTKNASKETTSDSIEYLTKTLWKHEGNTIGVAHTRWASQGSISELNSHPHNDITSRFSLVHNGVIENHNYLRKFLLEKGIKCISETDTEVIVQMIYYYSTLNNTFEESVKLTLSQLEGTWGIVVIDIKNPNMLISARHGSPILLGIGNNEIFIASEAVAFQKYTTKYISLNNNEMVVITYDQNKINILLSDNSEQDRIKTTIMEEILLYPDPHPHWTIREINEQPYAITAALNNGGRITNNEVILGGLNRDKDKLLGIENLIIIGCGTSRHAGLFISDIMRTMSGFRTVQVVDGSEFDISYVHSSDLSSNNSGLLALSQSGETKDVMRCLEIIAEYDNIFSFSVVNRVESQIARTTGCGVYLNAGREVAVASTKAFTSQIVILSLISIWYAQNRKIQLKRRKELIENLRRLSICYQTILNSETIISNCDKVANYLKNWNTCFILGKGLSAYIAYEGALKLKEIGYIHAEGYPGGSLKHGPFALIDEGTPIILILLDDFDKNYMESTISEVQARGAYTIVITNIPEFNNADITIYIPKNGLLSSLLAVVPLQLISYKLSILKGINPDKPKNLSKTISII